MRRIIENKLEDTINIEDALYYLGDGNIIAYISNGNNPTIAILINQGCSYGFKYFNAILSGSKRCGLKFCGSSREASIQLALKAGRDVFLLEDHHDLIELIKEKL